MCGCERIIFCTLQTGAGNAQLNNNNNRIIRGQTDGSEWIQKFYYGKCMEYEDFRSFILDAVEKQK